MKMSAFTKVEMSCFSVRQDLRGRSMPGNWSPSSSDQHALRSDRVKLSAKRSSFDSLKA